MMLQMDIGWSAPRTYTLETMKHTGTLVVRGMYIAYDDISYHLSQLRGTRWYICSYLVWLHPKPSSWGPRDSDQNNDNDWCYQSSTPVRATWASSSTGRPCCGRAVRLLDFCKSGTTFYQGWPLLRGWPKLLLKLRVTTGKRPLKSKQNLFVIRSIINCDGILQLFPRGWKDVSYTGIYLNNILDEVTINSYE